MSSKGDHSGEAFFQFLTGRLDALVLKMGRLGPWDVGAPAAVIQALGGLVLNESGEEYLFSEEDESVFIACPNELRTQTLEFCAQLAQKGIG